MALLSRHVARRGGIEKWSRHLAEGFAARGVEVTLLTSDALEAHAFSPSIRIERAQIKGMRSSQKMRAFDCYCQEWLQKRRIDLIFGMDRTSEQTHLRAGNGVHAAYLKRRREYEKGSSLKELLNPLNKTILDIEKRAFENPRLRHLFTNSHMVREELLSFYALPQERITTLHNGVEWKEREEAFKRSLARERSSKGAQLLFVGNGYQRKGLPFLLKALALLKKEPFHLAVVGKERKERCFIRLAEQLKLTDRITFHGAQQELLPFYESADLLVVPSLYDPFANVTVEALAMGLYVLSSQHNGGREVLIQESGAVIKALNHPESFAEELKRAFSCLKTRKRAEKIRSSVAHLELSLVLEQLITRSLESL